MIPRCDNPALGEALIERVAADEPLAPAQQSHLEECESCRASLEQLRRLARTWQTLAPTEAEIAAARARFAPSARTWSVPRMPPRALALALVFGVAAASGAARVAQTGKSWRSFAWLPSLKIDDAHRVRLGAPAKALTSTGAAHVPAVKAAARDVGAAPVGDAVEQLVAPQPTTRAGDGLERVATKELPAPAVTRHKAAARLPPNDLPTNDPPPAVATSPTPAPAPSPAALAPALPRAWLDAASAMRAGNYAEAERAFSELVTSADAATRDAARLARAQIWIAGGRTGMAQPELEMLSETGATPYVRERARNALQSMR